MLAKNEVLRLTVTKMTGGVGGGHLNNYRVWLVARTVEGEPVDVDDTEWGHTPGLAVAKAIGKLVDIVLRMR